MAGVLIRGEKFRHRLRNPRGEDGRVTGMMVYKARPAKDGPQPRRPEEARKVSSLEPVEGPWPCRVLDFGSVGSRTMREYISVVSEPLGLWRVARQREETPALCYMTLPHLFHRQAVSPSRIRPRRDPRSSPVPSGLGYGHLTGVPEWPPVSLPRLPPPCQPASAALHALQPVWASVNAPAVELNPNSPAICKDPGLLSLLRYPSRPQSLRLSLLFCPKLVPTTEMSSLYLELSIGPSSPSGLSSRVPSPKKPSLTTHAK